MDYTRETLENKTVAELRQICIKKSITGMSKKRKNIIIDALLDQGNTKPVQSVAPCTNTSFHDQQVSKVTKKGTDPNNVTKASFQMNSTLTKPGARFGDRTTTTIQVSCGAASQQFPVVGKSVGAVKEFLREILNIDKLADGLVNGKTVEENYILTEGDNLEYLKSAGRKG